ncbi:response regulator [Parasediminibacterium sp. JCM 36343]|uniref:response regulator n=1 Tax=Parasediminibacterium sp. JCM 36343 TaxID=3374279 RepID=UPI00397BEDED
MITVGIIEDDRPLRRNLEIYINMQKDLHITFSCNSMEAYLEQQSTLDEPFIIFIDLGLPGISGMEGITLIRQKWADVHIVVTTGNDNESVIFDCIQRGANGYLLKPFNIADLVKNIDIIRSGGALITPDVAMKLFKKIHKPQDRFEEVTGHLTTRENDVVNELLKGLTYKEIAAVLGISSSTVNDHLKNVYVKMGVRTKSELIAKLLRK